MLARGAQHWNGRPNLKLRRTYKRDSPDSQPLAEAQPLKTRKVGHACTFQFVHPFGFGARGCG